MYLGLLRKKSATHSAWGDSKMYTSGTLPNSQEMSTEMNKNGAIAYVRSLR